MISRIRAIFFRYLYELPSFDMMSGLFFWPVIDLLLWGFAMVWLQRHEHDPQLPQLILTALVLFQVFLRGAVDLAYFMLLEFWECICRRHPVYFLYALSSHFRLGIGDGHCQHYPPHGAENEHVGLVSSRLL